MVVLSLLRMLALLHHRAMPQFPSILPKAIFLDSGGVINDNKLRGPQWSTLVAEYMPTTILGGKSEHWAKANQTFCHYMFELGRWNELQETCHNFKEFERRYFLEWIQYMVKEVNNSEDSLSENCSLATQNIPSPTAVRIVLPEDEEAQLDIAKTANLYCLPRVKADFPGAVEAIKALKFDQGFEIYTCSGETSTDLFHTLLSLGLLPDHQPENQGLGKKPIFTKLFGPDLIDQSKNSSEFYKRIFQDINIRPEDALVVDDKEKILAWAKELGAQTLLINNNPPQNLEIVDYHLHTLAELPALTSSWKIACKSKNTFAFACPTDIK
ncbi:hypothetical protein K7432_009954 [Basidiobolus ranarum]|uniref:Uncharacterized protein n=1 Tax=Basidiobolus ranarum TaxID=34480 RepID=A0ABR2VWA2_9FUNG